MKLKKLIDELTEIYDAVGDVEVIIQDESSRTGFFKMKKKIKILNDSKTTISGKKISGNHVVLKTKGEDNE